MAGPPRKRGAVFDRPSIPARTNRMTVDPEDQRILLSEFRPARWLRNRHLQTMYSSLPWAFRQRIALRREELELPDGDVTAVDWADTGAAAPGPAAPLLVILHGLESSAESAYARMLMQSAVARGWHCCVLHFRDCGDYRNRLPRRYHAGETSDVRFFIGELEKRTDFGPILAAGYSLGGNVLLKYLGEARANTAVQAAVAVCVPFDLHECAKALDRGFSRVYQRHLLGRMKKSVARKFDRHTAAFDWDRAMAARTFAEFDDAVTAPLHGFSGMDEYYDRSSSVNFLATIDKPTLVINALDDPFMTPGVIPHRDRLSPMVSLEISEAGGHVGFIEGGTPWRPRYYLPGRVLDFLADRMAR